MVEQLVELTVLLVVAHNDSVDRGILRLLNAHSPVRVAGTCARFQVKFQALIVQSGLVSVEWSWPSVSQPYLTTFGNTLGSASTSGQTISFPQQKLPADISYCVSLESQR